MALWLTLGGYVYVELRSVMLCVLVYVCLWRDRGESRGRATRPASGCWLAGREEQWSRQIGDGPWSFGERNRSRRFEICMRLINDSRGGRQGER